MKSSLFKKIIFAVPLFCLILTSGCSTDVGKAAQDCAGNIILKKRCDTSPNQAVNANAGQEIPASNRQPAAPDDQPGNAIASESRVYLDSTESMKGFASPKENNKFLDLIEALGYAMPGTRLYRYGLSAAKKTTPNLNDSLTEISYSQELRKESFYGMKHNKDDLLINFLVSEEKPVRSVLITDGVYSSPGTELESAVANAIGEWIKKGRFFGILVFRSPFKGRLYSENIRSMIDKVDVPERPFYAFVFSPKESDFNDLKDRLKENFANVKPLVFPKEVVNCNVEAKSLSNISQTFLPPKEKYFLYMYTPDVFGSADSVNLYYDTRCEPVKDYPISDFSVNITPSYYSWQNEGFVENTASLKSASSMIAEGDPIPNDNANAIQTANSSSSDEPGAQTGTDAKKASSKGTLMVTLQRDASSPYSFYHLNFELSGKSLSPDVRSLSTPDDSDPRNAGKTFRFFELMSALTNIHLRNSEAVKLPKPLFVVLANR